MEEDDTKIEYKCTPDIKSSGFTPLMHAVMSNNLELAKNILENNPQQIDIKNDKGWTALHLASRNSRTYSSTEMVKLLLSFGANVNIQNNHSWSALHRAAKNSATDSSLETVELLLKAGADVNIQKYDGWTALHLAAKNSTTNSSLKTVELLLKAGAEVNIKNNDSLTPLELIMETTKDQNTINLLIKYGANVDCCFDEKQKQIFDIVFNERLKTEKEKFYEQLLIRNIHIFHQ